MKIAITGATGFLGSHAARILGSRGHQITALGRNVEKGRKLGVNFISGALSDSEMLERAFAGQDAVVHSAALSSPWGRPEEFYSANVIGTENVLKAARKAGVKRVVHISSPSIYVDFTDRENIREDAPLPEVPLNDYIRTKKIAEQKVDQAVREGLSVVTLRPQGIFGPGDEAIFPRIIRIARRGRFPMIGSGRNRIDITYVENVVDAIDCALEAPESRSGKKYNISNGEPVLNYEVIETILKKIGISFQFKRVPFQVAYGIGAAMEFTSRTLLNYKEPLLTRYSACVLAKSRTLSIDAARADLGYVPRVSVDEGVRRFVDWWREHGS